MKLLSQKKFQLYYILVAVILAAVLAIFYYNNLKVQATSDSTELAQEILRKNDNVLLDILDIETGTRGYIISDDNLFLETFNNAVKALNSNLAALSMLTKDNPKQSEQIASLKIKTAEKLILIRKLLDDRNTNLLNEDEKIEILNHGKVVTDEIKDIISDVNYDEYNSLKQRKIENENSSRNAEILFFLLLILIFVIFTLVVIIVKNLKVRNDELEAFTTSQKLLSNYSLSLIEASKDPLVTININGQITGMNEATVTITGVDRKKLIGSSFLEYFTEPHMAQEVYQEVFAKGFVSDSPLTIRHKDGKLTDVLFNGSIYKDDKGNVLGIVIVARDIAEQKWAMDLRIANRELAFQNNEKEKRAAELVIANHELAFQNTVKEKRAAELIIANEELLFQHDEKEKRAAELYLANEELMFQTGEKEKRAAELAIAGIELDFQNKEREKREIVNKELKSLGDSAKLASQYSLSLIEASRDPLVTISTEGKITDMNEATVKITGLERDKLLNSDFFTYFTDPQMAREVYQEVFAKGSVSDSPLTLRHKDGKLTDVLFNGSVYKDEHGNVLGVVVVARDITDQKVIETELIEAKVFAELATGIAEEEKRNAEYAALIAENAVKAKQQFLSNMSHEIRTPMNAIIGFTKVVLKTDLSEKQKEYLSAIKMSGDALIVLINDILDLAKVDAGKMTFEKIPFKLKSSISSMLHLFETKIQEKNLKLITEYDPNIPPIIIGDPVRLHQIILNLVSNAVKFTSKGKITVAVRLVQEDAENAIIEFAVTDTGIGIPEEKLLTIFDNFQQASSGTSRIYGGTGLGLAIVKQLVEPQGGAIDVISEVGVGTTFSFRLKFEKTDLEAELDTEILELDSEVKNIKVLVVEDIALNQLLMKTLLDDFGFERDIAENGKIAIEKLKNKEYDVILMDLQMPVMNGFESTEYIRKTLNSQIPIIALTADVTTVDLAKCKAVGMNDYIAKPVDERLLYSKIINIVRKTSILKSDQLKRKDMQKKQKCIDLEYLTVRTKSNPKLMMEMIAAYLQQTPPLINAMRQSLQNKDWALLKSSVHKMIPSFSIMGLSPEFEDMAKKVQDSATAHENMDEINNLVLQLENICNQACTELEIEFNNIKNIN
ncbi:PAS domain S-box protein [Flavobacterium frigoris]|uniref:Sensory/regulatory protein RpfC n=1 Tax=Flavobacterium frigoris (strain PS1) TaxID=1086011 RepID=H7FWB4_FLAFP|nr:PAS domain S-box protein [Flavobacterium frigoris]EIA07189.1 diguanylate cyclase/phosphodiesterase [Flavobacterium frigoris PS1]